VSAGNKTYEQYLKTKNYRQIIRQKPAKASGVRQPKKADRKMIGMGAKLITIVRAVMANFVLDCRAAEVPKVDCIRDVPGGVHNHAQDLRLKSFQNLNVGGGSSAAELYTIGPDGFEYCFIE
jgi:hypothetical protein